MKVIKEHIKAKSFSRFYLLYGSEEYLKKLYRDKLKAAILQDDTDINFSYFEGKAVEPRQVYAAAQTLPFFSDRRLILIENSGLFKNASELSELLEDTPETTVIIFVETEIDKRNKLFKLVKDRGTISEMNGLDEKNLKLFVASLLEQAGKKITEASIVYLLEKTGSDMINLSNEVEKLVSYTMGREVVTNADIDAVVTTQISSKIFQMIDAIGSKQQNKALELYYDLLSVREKPMSILYLISRHFNILLQAKNLQTLNHNSSSIAELVGVPPFTVNKYLAQARNFTSQKLKEALEFGAEIEEQVKTGRMQEKIGVELFLITFSKK